MTFLFVPDPRNFFHLSETVIFKLYIMSSIELIFSGVRNKILKNFPSDKKEGAVKSFPEGEVYFQLQGGLILARRGGSFVHL